MRVFPSLHPLHQPQPMYNQGFQAVVRAAARLRQTAQGARILAEWLGDGGTPVDRRQAQDRIDTCNRCIHNKPTDARSITKTVAEAILEQEQARNDLAMFLQGEGLAGTCDVCGCYLKLKVWVPLSYLGKTEMPDNCWISQERKAI
ncbi:MAG: hypothetical protein NT180_01605 [Actinobacteria bacterium]|nr:hypothetical protein [Actinomycetota bacterium]